jgi:hypothetical protein
MMNVRRPIFLLKTFGMAVPLLDFSAPEIGITTRGAAMSRMLSCLKAHLEFGIDPRRKQQAA